MTHRLLPLLTAITLAWAVAACGGSPEPPKRAPIRHDDNENAQETKESAREARPAPLASLGSLLIHKANEPHKVVEITLASDVEARMRPYVPLASLGSPLIVAVNAPHDRPPVLLRNEGGAQEPAKLSVTAVPTYVGRTNVNQIAFPTPESIDATLTGSLISVGDRTITIRTERGDRVISVPATARILRDAAGTPSDIIAGARVSVVKYPDGSMRSIRIYPPGLPTPPAGIYPLAGDSQGTILLTGTVTGINAGGLLVTAGGQTFALKWLPDASVTRSREGALTNATGGRFVSVRAQQQTDGTTVAVTLYLTDAQTPVTDSGAQRPLLNPAPWPAASPGRR
jgi:hypothetical protein